MYKAASGRIPPRIVCNVFVFWFVAGVEVGFVVRLAGFMVGLVAEFVGGGGSPGMRVSSLSSVSISECMSDIAEALHEKY